MPSKDTQVPITSALDIVSARQKGRALAQDLGFEGAEVTLIMAAISEVSRNIVEYARSGEIIFQPVTNNSKRGLCIVARDHGPGIADVERAMQFGYSTRRGLGVGLPGAKLLMDEFDVESKVGVGTTITMRKWVRQNAVHS
jgi:serine/threonine-protein kinase RsbT